MSRITKPWARRTDSSNVAVQHKAMAHRILDRIRKGRDVRADLVDWALSTTGDMPKPDPAPRDASRACASKE